MSDQATPRTLGDVVFHDLRTRILQDRHAVGDFLAPERELASRYRTNRGTVREAIRRLESAGLVEVEGRRGARVVDFRRRGTPAVVLAFLEDGTDLRERVQLILDLLRVRTEIFEMAIKLACERAGEAEIAALEEAVAGQREAHAGGDAAAVIDADVRWIRALMDATGSLGVRWFANPLIDAYRQIAQRFRMIWGVEASYIAFLTTVTEAIRARDAEAATQAGWRYHEAHDAKLAPVLEAMVSFAAPTKPSGDPP